MKMIEIKPINQPEALITVPGSKSYTQRALIMAALADGESFLRGPLISEDTSYLVEALRLLGAGIEIQNGNLLIQGTSGRINNPQKAIYLGYNGTAMRLLTTVVCLGKGEFLLTGAPRLLERPVQPLLEALKTLGVKAISKNKPGFPPVLIKADGLQGGKVTFKNIESSQYISSLLISAPLARDDFSLELEGSIPSLPYVEMTIALMKQFGVEVIRETSTRFFIKSRQKYQGIDCRIEGDVSSASYFFLAAALGQGTVRVQPILSETLQGDVRFLKVLEELGGKVIRDDHWVEVSGEKLISGDFIIDLGDMPDMVPTLAILAACRPGRTIIKNVAHLRIKESNRLEALVRELTKTGIKAEETEDGLKIDGGKPHGAEIDTYNDHRIAMSFAVLGLVVPGIKIKDPDCVKKSFPGFWEELKKIY
jgi:3-phosphoshikimate 1-carboxyvinyltransferase